MHKAQIGESIDWLYGNGIAVPVSRKAHRFAKSLPLNTPPVKLSSLPGRSFFDSPHNFPRRSLGYRILILEDY
jgi:hypothetical protein